jgi:broad specificity phosphatase PhoE
VVSPLRRTLQTATQGLGWLIEKGVPVQLRADWQENSDAPCDIGSAIPTMREEWPQFDWSTVDPIFPDKTGLYAYTIDALTKRGIEVRKWLRERPEKVIAVVSHSAFLRCGVSNRRFANADFRIFDFAEAGGQVDAQLVEWELTECKGGGLGKSPRGVWGFGPDEEAIDVKPE